jgi:hypothetical protein
MFVCQDIQLQLFQLVQRLQWLCGWETQHTSIYLWLLHKCWRLSVSVYCLHFRPSFTRFTVQKINMVFTWSMLHSTNLEAQNFMNTQCSGCDYAKCFASFVNVGDSCFCCSLYLSFSLLHLDKLSLWVWIITWIYSGY